MSYTNPEICSQCKGECCKRIPGATLPSDFRDMEHIRESIKSGRYCLDYWEGDPRDGEESLSQAYFIRPVIKGKEGKLVDPSWGGACTFLTDNGCSLSLNDRPAGCKELEPSANHFCKEHGGSKKEAAIAWISYRLGQMVEVEVEEC